MHALAANAQGPPPLGMSTPFPEYPAWDPATPYADLLIAKFEKPACADPIWSPTTDDDLMKQTLAIAEERAHDRGSACEAPKAARLHHARRLPDDRRPARRALRPTGPRWRRDHRLQPAAPRVYRYLQAIIDAGFTNRIMFGSDQMVWPGATERAIALIDEAPFLSSQQRRDISYHNAVRFLRLSKADIAQHHSF